MPWRKGPFSVFGIDIDAEWRSEPQVAAAAAGPARPAGKECRRYRLQQRLLHVPHVRAPAPLVLGFEPSVQHYYCFKALNGIAGDRPAQYRPARRRASASLSGLLRCDLPDGHHLPPPLADRHPAGHPYRPRPRRHPDPRVAGHPRRGVAGPLPGGDLCQGARHLLHPHRPVSGQLAEKGRFRSGRALLQPSDVRARNSGGPNG